MSDFYKIKISIFDIKYCPYCGSLIEKGSYEHPGDDFTYRGTYYTGKCSKCKKLNYTR